jgi:hypothetical protein
MDSPEIAVARYAANISLWALGVSAGSLVVAGCAFVLELRRWFDEGVKISMTEMPEAKLFGGGVQDDKTYLAITVANRGTAATTITHMVLLQLSRSPESISLKVTGRTFQVATLRAAMVQKARSADFHC